MLQGDAAKARHRLGWEAQTRFEDVIGLMVDRRDLAARERGEFDGKRSQVADSDTLRRPLVANVCSGRAVIDRELAQMLAGIAGVDVAVTDEQDAVLAAGAGQSCGGRLSASSLVGDPALLRRWTGWEPEMPLQTTLTGLWKSLVT